MASLAALKDAAFQRHLRDEGVEVFDGSRRYLEAVAAAGLRRAVVSSSAHTAAVLTLTGLDRLCEVRIDAEAAHVRHLAGKPAPDTYLAAAADLGVTPAEAAVYEDALAGVEAGRAGQFAWVVGVDRHDQAAELLARGADRVVRDLSELLGA